jgi:hypothetical protein
MRWQKFHLQKWSFLRSVPQTQFRKSFCINFYTKIGVGNNAEIGLEKEGKTTWQN